MSDLTIDQLLTVYTADDLYLSSPQGNTGLFVDWLTAAPFAVTADKWKSGGIASSITRVVAILYASFSLVIATVTKFGFLPTASGGWLRLLARYVYGVTPIFATSATGQVTIANSGGGLYSYAKGDLVVQDTDTGKQYRNLALVTINPGQTVTGIDIIALEVGTSSNAPPTKIDALATPQIGLTVSNPLAVVGQDDEQDEVLRQRCLDALGARSVFGPRSAYRYAVSVAKLLSGAPVNVNRVKVSPYSSTSRVDILLASPAGAVTPSDITAVADSVAELAEVDTDTVTVASAVAIPFTKSLLVYAKKKKGLDAATIQAKVLAYLIDFVANWPIGGRVKAGSGPQGALWDKSVLEAAKAADDTIWLVTADNVDLLLNPNEVASVGFTVAVRITEDE